MDPKAVAGVLTEIFAVLRLEAERLRVVAKRTVEDSIRLRAAVHANASDVEKDERP